MSLFLPSNLSPNFQEVVSNISGADGSSYTASIDFQFQVNSNGSCVRSYKLEILNGRNDAEIPEDNILATFYGVFDQPLYNKDIYTITLTDNQINDQMTLEVPKDYRWRLRLYEDIIDYENDSVNVQSIYGTTYVGAGHTVGSTKNVIWMNKINEDIVEDKYVQTVLYSDDKTNDFNPFYKSDSQKGDIQSDIDMIRPDINVQNGLLYSDQGKVIGIAVDYNQILPEYRKKITDGNMYISLDVDYGGNNGIPQYNTNQLPKLITDLIMVDDESGSNFSYILKIDERQGYDFYSYEDPHNVGQMISSVSFAGTYSLVYIQRQQIYSVDKSIGTHQLNKVTLDEPLDYSAFHGSNIETGLVSDHFDYGRLYIDPVKEFDSKLVPSAYINIAYTADQLIDTSKSGQYNLLSEKPADWDTSCEKYYLSYDGRQYAQVNKDYVSLSEEPANWSSEYKKYYESVETYKLISGSIAPIFYPTEDDGIGMDTYWEYNAAEGRYVALRSQPADWTSRYSTKYYEIAYEYRPLSQYLSVPYFEPNKYYKYGAPNFNNMWYYSYSIYQSDLSNYSNSLACVQLTNYVSQTGECALFSDLKFKPDRFYMYQIFVPDTTAPNYDASKADNPYKFYAGSEKTGTFIDKYVYLGGQTIYNPEFILDINGDGVFDQNDIDYLQNHIELQTPDYALLYEERVYDYDQSGFVYDGSALDYKDLEQLRYFYREYADLGKSIDELTDLFQKSLRSFGYWLPFDYNNRQNVLPIYSNHQIGSTNQYVCFIQPNLGINEDMYKPCMLQVYNNKCQYELYVTNYNVGGSYNKDYSIDKLDDSQWLIVLTYPSDTPNDIPIEEKNEIATLIQKPQTKYNIYTNFVNSIPEAYFYYRSNKTLEFEYQDFYSQDNLWNDIGEMQRHNDYLIIPKRDVIVRCKIYDDNDPNHLKNLVPIKYYRYTIGEVDQGDISKVKHIIYQSDILYDGKCEYAIKGLENCYLIEGQNANTNLIKDNPALYRIQITVEDEYDQLYEYAEDVYFGYRQEIATDRISAQVDCNKHANYIQFAAIKTFASIGLIDPHISENYVSIIGADGLEYNMLQDDAGNSLSIKRGENFKFVTKFRVSPGMFESQSENDVLSIVTDPDEGGSADCYKVTFDTRTDIIDEDGKHIINEDYLSFKLYYNATLKHTVMCKDIYPGDAGIVYPKGFGQMFAMPSENPSYIYYIEESFASQTMTTIQGAIDTNHDNEYELPISPDEYYVYDNVGMDINTRNKDKMRFLYLTIIHPQSDDISFNVTINNVEE